MEKNSIGKEKIIKRRRVNGTHRWTEAETFQLAQDVAEEVKHNPESYEKPTAQCFYKKIAANSPLLKTIDWIPMKNKMRHLKSTYLSALNWKNQTGAGLLANGDEKSVEEYIKKICPKWNYLEQIFGQRRGVKPSCVIETSVESDNIVYEDVNAFLDFNDDETNSDTVEDITISSPETSNISQSPINSNSLKESIKKMQQTCRCQMRNTLFSIERLICILKKRLTLYSNI